MFNKLKLTTKIILSVLVVFVLGYTAALSILISKTSSQQKESVLNEANIMAENYSKQVEIEIEAALNSARTLAQLSVSSNTLNVQDRRKILSDQLKSITEQNSNFLAVWTVWEPNALDNLDAEVIAKHSLENSPNGRFCPTWVRSGSSVVLESSELPDAEIEASNFYSIPKKAKEETILEPYFYSYTGDKKDEILETSVCVPIIRNGELLGVIGIDISLAKFQQMVAKIKPYEEGYAGIVSNEGVYLGARDAKMLGKKLFEVDNFTDEGNDTKDSIKNAISKGEKLIVRKIDKETSNYFQTVYAPFTVGKTKTPWSMIIAFPENKIFASITQMKIYAFISSIIIVLLVAFVISYVIKKVTAPIRNAVQMMKQLGKGNLSERLEVSSSDEIGILSEQMNMMAGELQKIIKGMYEIADGNFDVETKILDAKDEISPALSKMVSTLKELKAETDILISSAVEGDLTIRGKADKFSGGYKEIIIGINKTLEAVIVPITEGTLVLSKMAEGDLTARQTGDYKGDHKKIKTAINNLGDSLCLLIDQVATVTVDTANATNQISASIEEMATGLNEQFMQTNEVVSAVEEMSKTILENTQNTSVASDTAKLSGSRAVHGGEVVQETISGMNTLVEVVKKSADNVFALGENSDKIGEIIQVIDDIADQTNLLALNAAIEAARAGEQGRGFAVVADEVRKLAERTTIATKEIAGMIRKIQNDTKFAVQAMKEGTNEVEISKAKTLKAGDVLVEIVEGTNKVAELIEQVAAASEEQSTTVEEISKNIDSVSNVTQESTAVIQNIARAAEELTNLTDALQQAVSKFKIVKPDQAGKFLTN